MRVAVLAGGRSSEHEVSLHSAAAVAEGLAAAGHEVAPLTIDRAGVWRDGSGPLAIAPAGGLVGADVVFPVLHGPFGEDGTVQGLLELLDVPYVGAGVLASSVCMDKVVFKELMEAAGVPQVASAAVRAAQWREDPAAVRARLAALGTPVFVKPARLGSSVGIAKVAAEAELGPALEAAFAHDPLVIVEAFSDGLEVECSVLGLDRPEASVPGEIVLAGAEWYDYAAKYTPGGMELVVPARLAPAVARRYAGWRSRPSCGSAAPGWRGSTSSSRASACSSTSSTRCRASPRRASIPSCGRPRASRSPRCATGSWSSRSSAGAPSARAAPLAPFQRPSSARPRAPRPRRRARPRCGPPRRGRRSARSAACRSRRASSPSAAPA